jgi:tetratricopeptide (TPR) repeat protein
MCLWAVAAWPLVLWLVFLTSPVTAVQVELTAGLWLARAGSIAAVVTVLGLLMFPPFAAGLRLAGNKLRRTLTADRSAYMRALSELRHVETAARHLEVGRMALQMRELQAAAMHLSRALELEPTLVSARYQLAQLLLQIGRLPEARAHLQMVVEQDPGHAFGDALLQLGRCQHLLHDDRGAAELLQRHAREHGGSRKSHYWLAQSLAAIGDEAGARAALQVAAAPPERRLTPEEGWFRAWARVKLWRHGGRA